MLKKLSSTRLVVNHIEGVVHSHFFSFVQKESSQRAYRYRGASLEARRPQGGTSRQCPVIGIVPFAPPTCQQAVKARPTGHAPAEPLECGHERMVWVSEPIEEGYVLPLPDRDGSLKRLHRPNLLGIGWIRFMKKLGF